MATRAQLPDWPTPANVPGGTVRTAPLEEAASFLLDLIRFAAALLVVVAHVGHQEITTGFADRQVLGQVAVPVFFVLSGFVIRMVTRARPQSLKGFLIDRAARMYSVAIPAMAVTILISLAVRGLAPAYYARYFGGFSSHPVLRVLANLAFVSQSWGHTVIPFLNIPFWSLSYECLYYVAYGFMFYLRGWARARALVVLALCAGPQVIFLFPIWWLGCWIYDLYVLVRRGRVARMLRRLTLVYAVVGLGLAVFGHWGALRWPGWAVVRFGNLPHPLGWVRVAPERATLAALGTGVAAGVAMLLLLLLSDELRMERGPWTRRFRYLADGTFSIYLLHYPLMVLATATGLYRPGRPWLSIAVTIALCGVLIVAARPMDHLKRAIGRGLGGFFRETGRYAQEARPG